MIPVARPRPSDRRGRSAPTLLTLLATLAIAIAAMLGPGHDRAEADEPLEVEPLSRSEFPLNDEPDGPLPIQRFYLFDEQSDLDVYAQRWADPDYVVLRGDSYRDLLVGQRASGTSTTIVEDAIDSDGSAVITKTVIQCRIVDRRVLVEIDLEILRPASEPGSGEASASTSRPRLELNLEGLRPARAQRLDGEARPVDELAMQLDRETNRWSIPELDVGRQRIAIAGELDVQTRDGISNVALGLPVSQSTYLVVESPEPLESVRVDGKSLLPLVDADLEVGGDQAEPESDVNSDASTESASSARYGLWLTPRPLFRLDWTASRRGPSVEPLTQLDGRIRVAVDADAMETVARFDVEAIRGQIDELVFRYDLADEILAVTIGDRDIAFQTTSRGVDGLLIVPLPSTLMTREMIGLTIRSRRTLRNQRYEDLSGFALESAISQTGTLVVRQTGDLWASGQAVEGLRALDLQQEIPDEDRSPFNVLAYRITRQPFLLNLSLAPIPSRTRVLGIDTRLDLETDGPLATLTQTVQWDVAATPRNVASLEVTVPSDLDLVEVGPAEVVRATGPLPDPVPGALARTLTVRLSDEAMTRGRYTLRLVGRRILELEPSVEVRLGLLSLEADASNTRGIFQVRAPRHLRVDVESPDFLDVKGLANTDPNNSDDRSISRDEAWTTRQTWRYRSQPRAVALGIAQRPEVLSVRRRAEARIDPERIVVTQIWMLESTQRPLGQIPILVPPGIEDLRLETSGPRFVPDELDETSEATRDEMGAQASRPRRVLLDLSDVQTSRRSVTFSFATPQDDPPSTGDPPRRLTIPLLAVLDASSLIRSDTVAVSMAPGILVRPDDPGWTVETGTSAIVNELDPSQPWSVSRQLKAVNDPTDEEIADTGVGTLDEQPEEPSGLIVRTWRTETLELARAIVRHQQIITTIGEDKRWLVTTRIHMDRRPGSLRLGVPASARWRGVRIDDVPVDRLIPTEPLDDQPSTLNERQYRLDLPVLPNGNGVNGIGSVVELDLIYEPTVGGSPGTPPRLLNALVERTTWEVRVPRRNALLGTPRGWSDANRWVWSGIVWERQPMQAGKAFANEDIIDTSNGPRRSSSTASLTHHPYLFSKRGDPAHLDVQVVPRVLIFFVASGSALALVLVVLALSPGRLDLVLISLLLLVLTAWIWDPAWTALALQSSVVGVLLGLLSVLIKWAVRRVPRRLQRTRALVPANPGSVTRLSASGSRSSTTGRGLQERLRQIGTTSAELDVTANDSTTIRRHPERSDDPNATRPTRRRPIIVVDSETGTAANQPPQPPS